MNLSHLPDENSYRFVAILNKKIEIGKLMNALGHMTAGLTGQVGKNEDMCFLNYQDKDGGSHHGISHFPFIILAADNSNKIRKVRQAAIEHQLPFTDFTQTMTLGTSAEQLAETAALAESELEYYGLALFGPTDLLKQLTGKFSLFR